MKIEKSQTEQPTAIKKWFDEMVSNLKVDAMLLQADVLEKHKKEVYEAMISGDDDFMHNYAKKTSFFH